MPGESTCLKLLANFKDFDKNRFKVLMYFAIIENSEMVGVSNTQLTFIVRKELKILIQLLETITNVSLILFFYKLNN